MGNQPAKRPLLSLVVLICGFFVYGQEYSAGINTNNPNPNAVLHLVSPNGDQGLLIPQLTTSQRLQMVLGDTESGLLVYDATEGQFYYWHAGSWNPLTATSGSEGSNTDELQQLSKSGNIVSLSNSGGSFTDEVDDADNDPENELQQLSKSGNQLNLTNGGTINLVEGAPEVGQIVQWNGENWVPITPASAQSLSFEEGLLSISDGNFVDLNALVDADGDSTNEIQSLSLLSDQLSISGHPESIDLSIYKDQLTEEEVDNYVSNNGYVSTELDPTVPDYVKDGIEWNELTGIPADFEDGIDQVDDADADSLNEIQDLSLAGNVLSITNNSLASDIDLSGYLDNTDEQLLSLENDSIKLTNGGGIDISSWDLDASDDFDGAFTSLSGIPEGLGDGDDVDDADADATNEIQDLSLTGDILSLSDDTTTVDLSVYLDNTDEQDLTLSANTLSLTGDSTSVDLSDFMDNTDEQLLSMEGDSLKLTNGGGVDLSGLIDDADADSLNEIQDLSLAGNVLSITNNSLASDIDLSGYLDNTDEQDLTLSGNTLSLTGDSTSVDLSGYLDNTDEQLLSLESDSIKLVNGGGIDISSWDLDASDDFDGVFTSLSGIPDGLEDGDQVDDADADPTNEIQDLIFSNDSITLSEDPDGTAVYIFNGDFSSLQNVPEGLDDGDTYLGQSDVRFYARGDDLLQQQLSFSNGTISLTGSSTDVDLSAWDLDISKENELINEVYFSIDDTLYIREAENIIHKVEISTSGSDRRIKKDITKIDHALENIQKIGGYNYYLKKDSSNQYLKTGVIAQEVEQVFPSIVKDRSDGFKGVTYHELIPILIEAIKEQQQIINGLKAEMDIRDQASADQETRIAALEDQLQVIMNLMTK